VKIRDTRVLVLHAPRGARSAAERARETSQALATAFEADPDASATVDQRDGVASIRVGQVPVLELGPDDVLAVGAPGLTELAAAHSAEIDRALRTERRRARIAGTVFQVSLAVLSALIAWLLVGKLRDLDRRLEGWLRERRRRAPALLVRGVEVVSPESVAGATAIALRVARILLQVIVAYGWLVFVLSLFPFTREVGIRLGQGVVAPAAGTVARLAGSLPAILAGLVMAALLVVALRAIRIFFQEVASGADELSWVSADVAVPAGQLVSIGLVVVALVFAAPLLTGSDDGVLANLGTAALAAVALGAAPALANVAAGLPRIFGRTYRSGQAADVGGTRGVVRSVGLLDVELEDPSGRRVLVPHLSTLLAPTRLPGATAGARFELAVDPGEDQGLVQEILLRTGGPGTVAEILRLDATAAVYQVAGPGADLAVRVASALRAEGVKLGRPPAGSTGTA
jgi:small-conductance mechanosensitive channel